MNTNGSSTAPSTPTRFAGFPPGAFEFYQLLGRHNSREFWSEHQASYRANVRDPMAALLDELEPQFGAGKIFRPNRDVRFSLDKSPYKVHQGGFVKTSTTCGFYVQVDAEGLLVGGGWYASTGDQVAAYRESVLGPPGGQLTAIIEDLQERGYTIGGEVLKSRPRGVPADHPRVALLRHRTLTVQQDFAAEVPWLATHEAAERVGEMWAEVRPLMTWLGAHATDPVTPPRR